jgi:hypothetical protein
LLKNRLMSADGSWWLAPFNSHRDMDRRVSYLGRQFGAALATTGCQDGTAGTGTHTKAEAVLLGSTAVIRLKSPLAHVSYSSGSKVRPPDQGEELADAKFWYVPLPSYLTRRGASGKMQMRRKAYTWDFTTLGLANLPSQTGDRSASYPQLWLTAPAACG